MMRQTIPFECALFILCLLIIDPLFCKCCNITQFNNGSDTEQMEFRTDFSFIWGIKDYRVVYMINGTYVQTKIHAEVYHDIVNRPLYQTTDITLIGDVSRGNFSFILHEVSYDKAGLYELQVTSDTLNSTLKCIALYILDGPTNISFSPANDRYIITQGTFLPNITCEADCNPACNYTWYKGGRTYVVHVLSQTLSLGQVSDHDAATYLCRASRSGHTLQRKLTVDVIYGPMDIFPTSGSVFIRDIASSLSPILCSSRCWECNYTWTGPVNETGSHLSIGKLQKAHDGIYTCTATNTRSSAYLTTRISIKVRYGPDTVMLLPPESSHTVSEGLYDVNIGCYSECFPNCTYVWTKKKQGVLITRGKTLSFGNNITRLHAGEYTCTATNPNRPEKPSAATAINIYVIYPPDTTITTERHTDQIDTITLKCSAQGNPHTYTWQWTHIAPDNLTEVQRYTGIPNGGENLLVLKNTTYMDSGIYKCTVSNNIKTPTVNYESIRITDKPYVIEGQREFYAARQDNISMAVQVFSGPLDLLNITWLKGGNGTKHTIDRVGQKYNAFVTNEVVVVPYYTKHVSQPGYRCQLDIHQIQDEDFTEYNVLISNTEGTVAVKMFVIPQGAPGMPRQLEAVQNSVTTSSVVLTWRSGFHGGADQIQIFYIQMKTVTSPWNNRLNVAGWLKINAAFNATIDNLSPGTHYFFKACAVNNYGRSEFSAVINVTTKTQEGYNQASSSVGASIGGAISGVIAAIIVGVAILFLLRRYKRMPACMVKQGSKEVQMDDTVPGHIEVDAHSTVTEGEKRSANIAKDDSSGSSQYENMSTSGELSMAYEQLAVRNPANSQRIADSTNVQGKEPKMKPEHVYSSLQGGSSDTDKRRSNQVYTNLRGFFTTNVTTGSSKQSADADIVIYSNLRLQAD